MPRFGQVEMSDGAAEIVFLALEQGVEAVGDGEALAPFVIAEEDGHRRIQRFPADTLEESLRRAREMIAKSPPGVTAYALAFDGFITIEGTKFDAVLVEAAERGQPTGIRMAQRYTPKKLLRKFGIMGNPALLGECEGLLR